MEEKETMDEKKEVSLPEKAFTELAPGEAYEPVIPAAATVPEAEAERLAHEGAGGNGVGLGVFALLCAFVYWNARRGVRE